MKTKEFLRLTPRYFAALMDRHERNLEIAENRQRIADHMLAQLTAMVANTGFRGWEEPRQTGEFLPVYTARGIAKKKLRRNEMRFTQQMERTMERLVSYQAEQVKRGF